MPDFSELKSEYTKLWASMDVRVDRAEAVTRIARRLIGQKVQYQAVEARTGVPWFVIAALHNRESNASFSTYLGNGEPLNRMTRLVPKGRGPFASWQAGAIDALTLDGVDQVRDWSAERACFEIEKFNGFGYRKRGLPSPYLWSFSNHYTRGKYIADGRFSAIHVDQQCGAMVIIKRIMELDATARFKSAKAPIREPVVATGIGGLIAAYAHQIGAAPTAVVAILVFTALAAGIAYAVARSRANT